jgi:uncharacterized membrane protein
LKRKSLIGIIVVLAIAVTVLNPLISGIFAAGAWIYLVRMVRKQKNTVCNDQREEQITKRHLRRLKALLTVAGFSFLVFILGSIAHNALHDPSETEETFFFFVALAALLVFIVATAGGMVVFLKARGEATPDKVA